MLDAASCWRSLFPLYTVVLTSLSTQAETIRVGGLVDRPGRADFSAYTQILTGGIVTRAALVSIGRHRSSARCCPRRCRCMGAYGLSRPGSFGHRPILFVFLITMFFGAGLIPTYLLVSSLGLINSYWALILPGAVSAFNVLILRNFFMGIDIAITRRRPHRRRGRLADPRPDRAADVQGRDRGRRAVLRRRLLERVLQRDPLHQRQRQVAAAAGAALLRAAGRRRCPAAGSARSTSRRARSPGCPSRWR